MAQRILQTIGEARPAATGIYEGGLKWAMGIKLAAAHGTRKIGIETRREKIEATINAATEFNRLVHDRFLSWCIQNGVLADHSIAAKARKIISLYVRGLTTEAEIEKKYIPAPYNAFIDEVLKSRDIIEAYRKILRARRL